MPYRMLDVMQVSTFKVGRILYTTSWTCALLFEVATIGYAVEVGNTLSGTFVRGATLVFTLSGVMIGGTCFSLLLGMVAELLRWQMTSAALLSSLDQRA